MLILYSATPHKVHQPDTLQSLVQITAQNIQLETPTSWDASQGRQNEQVGNFKPKPFLSMFQPKRRWTAPAATEGPESVGNQAMFSAYNAAENLNNQRAEAVDLSDLPQVVLSMAQRVSIPDKISASIK